MPGYKNELEWRRGKYMIEGRAGENGKKGARESKKWRWVVGEKRELYESE